jgi:hypothetical protein
MRGTLHRSSSYNLYGLHRKSSRGQAYCRSDDRKTGRLRRTDQGLARTHAFINSLIIISRSNASAGRHGLLQTKFYFFRAGPKAMRLSQRGGSIYEARALGPRAFSCHTSWMVEDYVLQLRRSYYFSLYSQTEERWSDSRTSI